MNLQTRILNRIKREKSILAVMKATGWPREKASKEIKRAKKIGTPYSRYVEKKLWNKELDEIARINNAIDKPEKDKEDASAISDSINLQIYKHRLALHEENKRLKRLRQLRSGNFHFRRPYDKKLSEDQINEINEFWRKYRFAYPVFPEMAETFYNRCGIFDPRYIPYELNKEFLVNYLNPERYTCMEGKGILAKQLCGIKIPETIISAWHGIFYDKDYRVITREEAYEAVLKALESDEIVLKPTLETGGGKGVIFVKEATLDSLDTLIRERKNCIIIQKPIKQHAVLNECNESTVNSVRVTSFRRSNGEFVILAAVLKVGSPKARVDNYKHGGCLIGIKDDGTFYNWALNADYDRIDVLPSGMDLKETHRIPNFEQLKQTIINAHREVPQMRLLSWDTAINSDGDAMVIEMNTNGDMRLHQIISGPLFGKYTEEVLDEILLKKFYKEDSVPGYDIREYYNHIEVVKYCGESKNVVIPTKIKDKPVTAILSKAFQGNKVVESIRISKNVRRIGTRAFMGCSHLASVEYDGKLKFKGQDVFRSCPQLENKPF